MTTGHQLCLAGGPAFTFHKIQTAITLGPHRLQERWGTPVVPVFWLASEDHDFEEVRSLWDGHALAERGLPNLRHRCGPVGRIVHHMDWPMNLEEWARDAARSERLEQWMASSFLPGSTLSQAMRHWVHAMFGPQQVVVIDADEPCVQGHLWSSVMQREVREGADP